MTMTPKTRFKPADLQRAKDVKVVFFDVDGVLTDGGLWFSEAGETLKRFHTLDGHGLMVLQRCGVTPVIITGRDSGSLRNRLGALGVLLAVYGT
nr:3-deoxy-D-manno-octulosonate 8-phosphate phosphatase [Betaproteobacteria bacterium]